MPKLLCPCGYIYNLSDIPDEGWITIRDQDWEEVTEAEIQTAKYSGTKTEEEWEKHIAPAIRTVNDLSGRIYECPQCRRLMWQKPGENKYEIFSPEKV